MTSTDLAIRESSGGIAERDIIDGWIAVFADVAKLADYIAETDFVPKALRNRPAAVAACILTGRELGIGPMAALKSVHMVQGVPSLSAEYKRARALAAGHEIVIDETNSTRCVARGRRAGSDKWLIITWTLDMAKRAKIAGKDVWQAYPQRMLQARATGELCDLVCPDATLGLATTEELEDGGLVVTAEVIAGPGEETAAIEPPKATGPRTARRRTPATPDSKPTEQPKPAAAIAPQGPPLPGEEQPGPTSAPAQATASPPSTSAADEGDEPASRGLIGVIAARFKFLGFTDAERAQRLAATSTIIGRDITSANELTQTEARVVSDTLARCKDRDQLTALLIAGDKPGTETDQGKDTTN